MRTLLTSFFSFLKKKKFPTKEQIVDLIEQKASFYKGVLILVVVLVVSLFLSLLMSFSDRISREIPDYGGTLSEGVIGAPRFINPLLSASETDQLLTTIVYSGLVKDSDDGTLSPVLSDHYIASPDGKEYRFSLKNNLTFSDRSPLSSADVLFTFETKKRLALLSDPTSSWAFISTEAPDANTVIIRTSGDSESLKEKLSLGIIPKNLWEEVDSSLIEDSSLNTSPVGAGPFMVKRINYKDTVPKEVVLKRNPHFTGPKPYIKTIRISIFANQLELKDAIRSGEINSTNAQGGSYIDNQIKEDFLITQVPTEKSISLFSLHSETGASSNIALKSIEPSIDRNKIIAIIENGYGRAFYSFGSTSDTLGEDPIGRLTKLGYKYESGTLTKANTPISISIVLKKEESLLETGAELSKELSAYGINVELKVFDQGLFTDQVRRGSYPFILGTEADIPSGYEAIIPLYTKIIPLISTKDVHSAPPKILTTRSELLRNIEAWYIRTDKVLKWFK